MQKHNPRVYSRFIGCHKRTLGDKSDLFSRLPILFTRARFLFEIKRAATFAMLICSADLYATDIANRELDLSKPLGSMQNPVRACGPAGQKEYLMRLRCPSGEAPKFARGGSMGGGPYGSVVDGYNVECAGTQTLVIIDMYSCKQRELRPVPGYTILADLPAKIAKGCPPVVVAVPAGEYVFDALEVSKPLKPPSVIANKPKLAAGGWVYFSFVVNEQGVPIPSMIEVKYAKNESMKQPALDFAKALRFEPAIHHDDCAVKQRVEFGIDFVSQ